MNTAHISEPIMRDSHRDMTTPKPWAWASLVAAAITLGGLGCASVTTKVIVGNQQGTIQTALKEGKAVLIAEKTIFEYLTESGEDWQGGFRPPLTYWVHRATKKPLVLGGSTTKEGRGKMLSNEYHFFILDPGDYDLMGFTKKTRHMANLYRLPKATAPIRSRLGFVQFSGTTLPSLYEYQAWVPPEFKGTSFNGNMITHWYDPGYYKDAVGVRRTEATHIDFRGVVPYDRSGNPNLATFSIKAGEIALIGDFGLDYTYGPADMPRENQWICPLESLTYYFNAGPEEARLQKDMSQLGYKFDLVKQVRTVMVVPGAFFSGAVPTLSSHQSILLSQPSYLEVTTGPGLKPR